MHFRARTVVFVIACWLLPATQALGQVPSRIDSLNRALTHPSGRFDSLEAGLCPADTPLAMPAPSGDRHTDSLAVKLQSLNRRVAALRATRCPGAVPAPAQPADTSDDLAAIRAAAAQAAGQPSPQGTDTSGKTKPAEPAPSGGGPRGANLLNPEISATGDVRLVAQEGVRGFRGVPREFELAFQSALDPYSNTKIFLTFEDDEVGVEEGYIYWTGLPGRVRLDVGKFRQQIGDLNRWHLHALPETEYPLVYQRFLAPEGLTGVGLSLYTALPISIAGGTHEIWLQGTSAESDPLFAGGHQPVLLARLQNFWQLSRSTYAQVGVTGLGGNNDDVGLRSRLAGLDFRFTYRPP